MVALGRGLRETGDLEKHHHDSNIVRVKHDNISVASNHDATKIRFPQACCGTEIVNWVTVIVVTVTIDQARCLGKEDRSWGVFSFGGWLIVLYGLTSHCLYPFSIGVVTFVFFIPML